MTEKLMMYWNQSILIMSNIQKSLGKGSGCIVDSVIEDNINISKYNPLAGSSYIKLLNELDYPRKGSISVQNIEDNDYLKLFLVRYLNLADHHPAEKAGKDFSKRLDFRDITFSIKTRELVFLVMKIRKNI